MTEGYLNIEEARQALKISRLTLYRWINAGKIPATKVGSTYRIKKQDIDDYLAGKLIVRKAPDAIPAPSRGPLIITARDIELWATNNTMAEEQLPELVSRLIRAHRTETGLIDLHMPSGNSIGEAGWDGRVEASVGNLYVPAGVSAWEMGIGDSQTKATKDHTKRTATPLNVKPAQTTFTFVTPRTWEKADDWKARKKTSGWKDIKIIDANDLESWLDLAPAVKSWFLGVLNRPLDGIKDLETFWEDWSTETNPPISIGLAIAGREEDKKKLRDSLLNQDRQIITIPAESRAEALAFIAATILDLPDIERDNLLSSTLVIESQSAWDNVIKNTTPLLLVSNFDDPQRVGKAISAGHRVIIAADKAVPTDDETKVIARPRKESILKELELMGVPESQRATLAAVGRHSLVSLWRRLSLTAVIKNPAWTDNADVLIPALLVGKWDESNDADKEVLSRLYGQRYDIFSGKLEALQAQADSPIGKVGTKWYVASKEDVWRLLHSKATAKNIRDFIDVAIDVLSEQDPAYEIDYKDRWMANIYDKKLSHSAEIRQSLADTTALLSARYKNINVGQHHGEDIAAKIVRELLGKAQADKSGHLWASLGSIMPLLAEAAPNEFIDALDASLREKKSGIEFIFQDFQETSSFSSHSDHTGFLWALENLAWSPTYLARVSNILCKLHEMDPGGKLSNRPLASLKDIFLSWHPQTKAGPEQRIEILESIVEKYPETGWELLLNVLPDTHGFTTGSHKPKWQEWSFDDKSITYAELFKIVDAVSTLLLNNAGTVASRWETLIERYPNLAPEVQKKVSDKLKAMDPGKFKSEDRMKIWNALRHFIYQHRRFSGAKWAVGKDQVESLVPAMETFEPTILKDKHAWLFGHHVDLPIDDDDWEKYELKVKDARLNAVQELYKEDGLKVFKDLSESVDVPYFLGVALGQSGVLNDADAEDLLQFLESEDNLAFLARGYVAGRFYPKDWKWAEDTIKVLKTPDLISRFLTILPNSQATWELASADSTVEKLYWEKCSTLGVENDKDFVFSAQKLLAAGRPFDAVEVLGVYAEKSEVEMPVDLAMDALKASVESVPERVDFTMFRYYVTKLLDILYKKDGVDESRLAQVEWQLLPVLRDEHRPKVLHRELSKNPEFFAEIISWVYRARGTEKRKLSKQEETKAKLGNELLDTWHQVPGTQQDGSINQKALDKWIDEARKLLKKSGRLEVGDHLIGKVLGSCAPDPDGMWPSLPVRNVIERIESTDIEDGLRISVYNSRGFTSRGLGEGGAQERGLAKKYDDLSSKAQIKWPRTAYVLLRIAETWRREAERHDNEAIEEELE